MASEEPNQKFGDYHLVERIAVGGMAEVWRARAYGLAGFEKTLVIKKILNKLARDEEFVRLFIDEARIAVLLQHSNIVQVFDLGTADGTLYMAMEFVHGLDLSKLAGRVREQEPFPLPLVLFIVSEVLKALRFAHERRGEDGAPLNLVHCDMSPHNILVSYAGEVKITDFGISRAAFQARSLHDTVRGKYAYMSPEQIDNVSLDGRSDIFSLGIVLWELVTGRRLFKSKTRDETLTRVKRAEVPSPRLYRPGVSESLEALILKALARKPEHRFQSAAEMLDALGMLMVREGHRATNHELAGFLEVVGKDGASGRATALHAQQHTMVVMCAEASVAGVSASSDEVPSELVQAWTDSLVRAGAQIWELEHRSFMAVWLVDDSLAVTVPEVVRVASTLRRTARKEGCYLAVGVAPGRSSLLGDTRRPALGWELAGPFYLARWMMNLSAHRGRLLLTKMAQAHLGESSAKRLGRVSIEEGRYIHLYEVD